MKNKAPKINYVYLDSMKGRTKLNKKPRLAKGVAVINGIENSVTTNRGTFYFDEFKEIVKICEDNDIVTDIDIIHSQLTSKQFKWLCANWNTTFKFKEGWEYANYLDQQEIANSQIRDYGLRKQLEHLNATRSKLYNRQDFDLDRKIIKNSVNPEEPYLDVLDKHWDNLREYLETYLSIHRKSDREGGYYFESGDYTTDSSNLGYYDKFTGEFIYSPNKVYSRYGESIVDLFRAYQSTRWMEEHKINDGWNCKNKTVLELRFSSGYSLDKIRKIVLDLEDPKEVELYIHEHGVTLVIQDNNVLSEKFMELLYGSGDEEY